MVKISKLIFNKAYISAMAILIISGFISFCSNMKYDIFKTNTVGFVNLFVFCFVSNPFIEVFAPIIPGLVFIGAINTNRKNGRENEKSSINIFSIIIAGGSIFVISSIIVLILFYFISPNIGNTLIQFSGLFSSYYINSKLIYILFYMIHSFVFGGVFSILSFSIYNLSSNKFYALLFPVLIYRIPTYIPIIQNSNINEYYHLILPYYPYEIIGFGDSLWINIWQLVLIILITLILLTIKEKSVQYRSKK